MSDHSLVKRQFQIFERALKKFKSDVDLWIQYIQVAKREGARTLIGKVVARYDMKISGRDGMTLTCAYRALQLHPNVPALYILGAAHEVENQSPSAARTLLQRGLRVNKESIELWTEYVRMEIGFAETMGRRWSVLGIDAREEEREIMEGGIAAAAVRHAVAAGGGEAVSAIEMMIEEIGAGTAGLRRVAGELACLRRQERGSVGVKHAEGHEN